MPALHRLALLIEYDGTAFAGSQFQTNGPSIQAELERAIQEMTRNFSRVAFAGRTDAGVHALGQVVAFDTPAAYSTEAFVGGINVRLPDAIAVRQAMHVGPSFDPRRDARWRCYRYSIVHSVTRAPIVRHRAWQVASALDDRSIREAAALLIGEQDFAAFASAEAGRGSTRREMRRVDVARQGRCLTLEFEANAFLMHQVRRTASALVGVGSGKMTLTEFTSHLRAARPGSYQHAAPSQGLCLMAIDYMPPIFGEEREHVGSDENI